MGKTDDDLIRESREAFNEAKDSDRDQRELIDEDTRFAIDDEGCQWPENVRRLREGSSPPRPCLTINKIPEKIDQAEGEFRQLEPSVKCRGVDSLADPKVAEIRGGLIRHIQYDSSARSAYNHAYTSVLYGGRGAWRIAIENDEDDPFIRCIKIKRIPNVLSVYWDQYSKEEDKSDARRFWITEVMSELAFKAAYPKATLSDWVHDDKTMEHWRTKETIRVAESWWKEKVDRTYFRVESLRGKTPIEFTVAEDNYAKLEDYDRMTVKQEKTIETDKVKWGIMTHDQFLEGPFDDWPSKYIPIVVVTGKEVNVRGKFKERGMTRFAKGPQRMYNYWSTVTTETIALAPKVPYLVTPAMINGHQNQWDAAATQNFTYLLYNADSQSPNSFPKRESPPQLSTAHAHELARMDHDIMASMGMYKASLGDEGREKSGRAIREEKQQGSIGTYTFTDKFKNGLIYSTKIINDLIPYVFDTERVLRITGEDGAEKTIPVNAVPEGHATAQAGDVSDDLIAYRPEVSKYVNDLSVGKYDVVVTMGPAYSTQRQEATAMILDLIKAVPQLGMPILDILAKNLDIPGSDEIVKRVKKLIPPGMRELEPGEEPPPEQPPDPKLQIETQKMMLKFQELMLKQQEQNRKEFETAIKSIKDLAEAESKERGSQLAEFTAIMQEIKSEMQLAAPTRSKIQPAAPMPVSEGGSM